MPSPVLRPRFMATVSTRSMPLTSNPTGPSPFWPVPMIDTERLSSASADMSRNKVSVAVATLPALSVTVTVAV